MAKAVEDTVFYRYNRLIALNEVGGTPNRFGADPATFHAAMERRLRRQARGLSATATHDTGGTCNQSSQAQEQHREQTKE